MTRQLRNKRHLRTQLALMLVALTIFTGCHPTQPFYFHEDGDLSHYLDHATALEDPDNWQPMLEDVEYAKAPMTITNPDFDEMWDMSLEEVVSIAMQNSKVVRNLGGVTPFGFADALVGRTGSAATIYDTAITEVGVEQALAAFDAEFRLRGTSGTNGILNTTDRPSQFSAGIPGFPQFQRQTDGGLRADLTKQTASGSRFTLSNQTDYRRGNSVTAVTDGSFWTTALEARVDHPLLRGSNNGQLYNPSSAANGTKINRIPVLLARINTDVSLATFEASVRNLVLDIENTYWDLHAAYRNLETSKIGRDSAQVTWNNVYEKVKGGIENAQAEAQSREQYFFFRSQLETALRDLYNVENRLRYLMGIAATDGRLVRPSDEPTAARITHDWRLIHTEALLRSPELRQQKWTIESQELRLALAKNSLLPQLDVGAFYRWVGAGDDLINADRNGLNFPVDGSTAFDELTEGNYQEAGLLFTFGMPIGFRSELAGVRAAQLGLVRSQAQLEDMELNTSHLLTTAVRNLDFNYQSAQTHFNRWKASQAEVDSVDALYRGGKTTLDLVLDAQRRRAQAQIDYYRALSEYNKSIAEVHFRKGSLLEYNNIHLAEGPWADKAYWDAMEHARERDASYYLNYGYTRPGVISQGPVGQGPVSQYIGDMPVDGSNAGDGSELVPTPAPTPAERPEAGDDAPQEPGPITTRPEGPALNAPLRAGTQRGSLNVATHTGNSFEWGSLGLTPSAATSEPSADGNALRQASYGEPLRQ
ncbi:MAG: TolC family protein [Planctomycetes bacterium]|nr:TolC family protein [Planctomycetota bacterium]